MNFKYVGILLAGVVVSCSASPLPPEQLRLETHPTQTRCSSLSGSYQFIGESVNEVPVASLDDLRFDGTVMASGLRIVVDPHTATLRHDVAAGLISVDVVGNGFDDRFKLMSAKLPLVNTFSCVNGAWELSTTSIGSGGGGRSTETISHIKLLPHQLGLVAERSKTIDSGTFTRTTSTRSWKILFKRKT